MHSGLQNSCLILGILCILYYIGIVIYAGITADFAWIWLFGGALLLVLQKGLMYQSAHPESTVRFAVRGIFLLLAVAILVAVWIGGHIVGGIMSKPQQGLEYVVVLGAQVRGSTVSRALKKRLDAAVDYAGKNPDTVFVLSGGQGSGEDISEAEAMRRYMREKGVEENRLILEDRSTSTVENLEFSALLAPLKETHTGILSNDFHVYRAGQIAKQMGYQHISRIPASSDPGMQPHYIVREICAVLKEVLTGAMKM